MNKDATEIVLGDAVATCDGIELRLRMKDAAGQYYGHTTALPNASLNAAAPEMARLLLEAQWASGGGTGPSADDQHYSDHSCFFCEGFRHERSGGRGVYKWTEPAGHAADCCLVAVLRKAGVLP